VSKRTPKISAKFGGNFRKIFNHRFPGKIKLVRGYCRALIYSGASGSMPPRAVKFSEKIKNAKKLRFFPKIPP
jgi:hypothetical protein